MKISLLTDAPKYNLALMQLSAWHKANGDSVALNMPLFPADYTYASIIYDKNLEKFVADEYGGPAFSSPRAANIGAKPTAEALPHEVRKLMPDYDLYGLDFSLGYSYRPCTNMCQFCTVPLMPHPDLDHHSIYEFHNPSFNKICLLNNNTFQDPRWKDTFNEIWDADLEVIEHGFDLRLIDDERAAAIKKTKFKPMAHFAWDRMQDEALIVHGLRILKTHKIRARIYVLVGYNTTEKEDIYRCQIIKDFGQDPYIMPYSKTKYTKALKRFVDTFMWRKHKTMAGAWACYS